MLNQKNRNRKIPVPCNDNIVAEVLKGGEGGAVTTTNHTMFFTNPVAMRAYVNSYYKSMAKINGIPPAKV